MDKKSKKDALAKQAEKTKQYYDVKVETMLPATVIYRVLAEDPEQALQLSKHASPNSVQYKLIGKKDIMAKVYDAGTIMMRLMRKLSNF